MGAPVLPELWTHEETAACLRVDPTLLTYLVTAGAGPTCYWVGRHRRYDPAGVFAWLQTTTGGARRRPGRHAAPRPPSLTRPAYHRPAASAA
jgi:hypothetical protein